MAAKYLAGEANKPRVPTQPLKEGLRKLMAQEESLMEFVLAHRDTHDLKPYLKKGDLLREQIMTLQAQLRNAEAANAASPPPLDVKQVLRHLEDMRGLLNQNVEKSAAMLRTLVDKIVVREVREPGKRWASWAGEINTDLIQFMANAVRAGNYPCRDTLEFLSVRRWIKPVKVEIPLDLPHYARLAPVALDIYAKTKKIKVVANALGVAWETAQQMVTFAQTGRRLVWDPPRGKRKPTGHKRGRMFKDIAEDVARMKDEEHLTCLAIAKWLKETRGLDVGLATVRRAWDHAHQREVLAAAKNGEVPVGRQRYCRLGEPKYRQIRQALAAGKKLNVIAKEVGCGVSTVVRERKRLSAVV